MVLGQSQTKALVETAECLRILYIVTVNDTTPSTAVATVFAPVNLPSDLKYRYIRSTLSVQSRPIHPAWISVWINVADQFYSPRGATPIRHTRALMNFRKATVARCNPGGRVPDRAPIAKFRKSAQASSLSHVSGIPHPWDGEVRCALVIVGIDSNPLIR
jgi:hypothetical protein